MTILDITIRNGRPEDWSLVLATWLRSSKHSGYGMKRIEDRAFFKHHEPLIKRLLLRGQLDVAVHTQQPTVVLGYMASEAHALHFVYVKKTFRRFGIASRLLSVLPLSVKVFTYMNDGDGAHALVKKLPNLVFNPYAIEPEAPHV